MTRLERANLNQLPHNQNQSTKRSTPSSFAQCGGGEGGWTCALVHAMVYTPLLSLTHAPVPSMTKNEQQLHITLVQVQRVRHRKGSVLRRWKLVYNGS